MAKVLDNLERTVLRSRDVHIHAHVVLAGHHLSGASRTLWDAGVVEGRDDVVLLERAGLIHRLIVTRVPVLIGEGIPLFGPVVDDIALTHVATRHYASGLVQSEYEVAASC